MKLEFSSLCETMNVRDFDCGEEKLNEFLKHLALSFQKRHFGVTIICHNSSGAIVGFYTLCPACIQRAELPQKMFTGTKPHSIPAFRLCRLAIAQQYHGQGFGSILLVHALKKCLEQAKQMGGSVIIVDAKHNHAKSFYEHFGFISIPGQPYVLVQKIKNIEAHFLPIQ